MLAMIMASIVDFCRRRASAVVVMALLASMALGLYVANNIAINTDINQLISENIGWRQREKALESAFPHKVDTMVIVIDSDNPAKAENAAATLAQRLSTQPSLFSEVSRPDALPFFHTNGLLFLSKPELMARLDQITSSQPLLGIVAKDPSVRGFLGLINLMTQGAAVGAADPQQTGKILEEMNAAFSAALQQKNHVLDLASLSPASSPEDNLRERRKYIITKPVLDYSALQPGEKATQALRQAAKDLNLTTDKDVKIRLTGAVPLNDEEFASVAEGTGLATIASGLLVLTLLFLAMRSWRIVLPIALTLTAGLIASTAFATVAVGSLNLISVAFAVMFIGIAVDFGIQFGVRYRDQRQIEHNHAKALRNTATVIAAPLAMAAGSTALGFLSFIPTDYRGVSELGLIAGAGMIIAFILNITLLPALMTLTRPPAESEPIGFRSLKPLNDSLMARRKSVMLWTALIALTGIAITTQLKFDFDPLNLKNPHSESVSTMFEAIADPDSDAYAAQLLAATPQQAAAMAAQAEKLPQVDHVMTFASFVPEDQAQKLALIAEVKSLLAPTYALPRRPEASEKETVTAMRDTALLLRRQSEKLPNATQLADTLEKLAQQASPQELQQAFVNIVEPAQARATQIHDLLQARPVGLQDLPAELKRDWISNNGQWLIEIFPKRGPDNNPRDPAILNAFIDALQQTLPDVSGAPVSMRESGRTVINAFTHAGIYGTIAIALLSLAVLRRFRDVVLMMIPLAVAGILTLATITVINLPLNFANVIALPLLLSLGVSYSVYFVFHARTGRKDFLQSSMARAVLFSAATVFVAFASLSFSSHLGTRGMGELLTIALLYSLLCTLILMPTFYGSDKPNRTIK